jgi:hypothetical protein
MNQFQYPKWLESDNESAWGRVKPAIKRNAEKAKCGNNQNSTQNIDHTAGYYSSKDNLPKGEIGSIRPVCLAPPSRHLRSGLRARRI